MVEIWFESHGTTLDNEAKKASGWDDVELSDLGRQQAIELVERSKQRNLSAIFCSDLQRSVMTAVPTADALQIPIYSDRRLRECAYGDMTGQPSAVIEQERSGRITTPFPNGESYEQSVSLRMSSFFAELKENFDAQTVLIIGHRATQYGLEVFASGKTLEECISEHNEQWRWQPGWKYEIK